MYVKISTVIGSHRAISYTDGEKLYDYLNREFNISILLDDKDIIIDFIGIEILINAFINASLYRFISKNRYILDSIEFMIVDENVTK